MVSPYRRPAQAARAARRRTAVLAGAALVTACGGAQGPAGTRPAAPVTPAVLVSPPVLAVEFDDRPIGSEVGDGTVLRASGTVPVRVEVSALAGGELATVPGPGGGAAVRFPAVDGASKRRVVVTVVPVGDATALDPGFRDFSFGASFALDAVTEGRLDNGNNLLQRGLFSDRAQFKIQVDQGRVSCRVAGDAGELVAVARRPVEPGTWYAATCSRIEEELVLEVVPANAGTQEPDGQRVAVTGPTGHLAASPGTPLVAGGKAGSGGTAAAGDSDQFNGLVDDVVLRILSTS